MYRCFVLGLCCWLVVTIQAQPNAEKKDLNIFLDCAFCDNDYLKTNLDYVNYVRNPQSADVHVLITRIPRGSNSYTYQLDFIGRAAFDGMRKALSLNELPNTARQERQRQLTEKIAMGLVPFWMETDLANELKLTVVMPQKGENEQEEDEVEDPWNNWVFSVEGGGSFRNETIKKRFGAWGRLRGDRVTEQWRIRNILYGRLDRQRFENDGEIIRSATERNYIFSSIVRSINERMSAGMFASVSQSTYSNLDLSTRLAPAIEFSLFPYSEVYRREVTVAYRVSHLFRDYSELTIFQILSEHLFNQSLVFQVRYQQPWGSLYAELEGSHFLNDFSQNRIEFNGELNIRLIRGLSLTVETDFEIINDQRSLPAGEISLEDLLLAQRQVATNFRWNGQVGVRYTFGSIYNNVVNTRL